MNAVNEKDIRHLAKVTKHYGKRLIDENLMVYCPSGKRYIRTKNGWQKC